MAFTSFVAVKKNKRAYLSRPFVTTHTYTRQDLCQASLTLRIILIYYCDMIRRIKKRDCMARECN